MNLIETNIERLRALCKKYRVAKLWVFGSILTPHFTHDSDVDFSVNFDSAKIKDEGLDWADIFFDFIHDLEVLFGRRVDLVCDEDVSNSHFRKELDATKILVYES